jgi:hypothetical protein
VSGAIQSITLQPKPSQQLHIWRLVIHLLAFITTLFAPLMLWHKVMLVLTLVLYSYFSFRQGRGTNGRQIIKVTITPYGRARMVMGDRRKQMARIRQDSLVTPWLIVLRFDLDRGWLPQSLVLTSGTISKEELRQLRVLLRFSEVKKFDPAADR